MRSLRLIETSCMRRLRYRVRTVFEISRRSRSIHGELAMVSENAKALSPAQTSGACSTLVESHPEIDPAIVPVPRLRFRRRIFPQFEMHANAQSHLQGVFAGGNIEDGQKK